MGIQEKVSYSNGTSVIEFYNVKLFYSFYRILIGMSGFSVAKATYCQKISYNTNFPNHGLF